jgi:anti-sigma factor RsiW
MDCNESQKLMSAYLDGELEPSAATDYAAHLASCAACQGEYTRLVDLQTSVKVHAACFAAPAALRNRILSDLDAGRASRSIADATTGIKGGRLFDVFGGRLFSDKLWGQIKLGIAGVSSVAFAAMLALYLQVPSATDRLNQEIVAAHYRSLQVDHLADVASTDQHTVKPWFSGKLDFSPPVVDLAQQGYTLIGGRLDYVNQHSVAGLAYRRGKHLINLFVWPEESGRDVSAKMTSIHGFHLLRWSHGGMTYTAISDMDEHELAEFQALLAAQMVQK